MTRQGYLNETFGQTGIPCGSLGGRNTDKYKCNCTDLHRLKMPTDFPVNTDKRGSVGEYQGKD